jgi:acid phosphatase
MTSEQQSTWTGFATAARYLAVAVVIACLGLPASNPAAAQAAKPAGCDNLPKHQELDTTPPINIGLLVVELIYYRCTRYDDEVGQALADARAFVAQRAPQVSKAALVLDIDETSLSNWEQIQHNRFGYAPSGTCDLKAQSACGQHEWELSAQAIAIQPTLDLFNLAKGLKDKDGNPVAVFFITGRYEDPFERTATEWNLRKVGYDGWQHLYMRPDSSRTQELVSAYKARTRAAIEDAGYTIIANVGDQWSDLVGNATGDHADKCFKVPNPFYFIAGDPIPDGGLTCSLR